MPYCNKKIPPGHPVIFSTLYQSRTLPGSARADNLNHVSKLANLEFTSHQTVTNLTLNIAEAYSIPKNVLDRPLQTLQGSSGYQQLHLAQKTQLHNGMIKLISVWWVTATSYIGPSCDCNLVLQRKLSLGQCCIKDSAREAVLASLTVSHCSLLSLPEAHIPFALKFYYLSCHYHLLDGS